MKKRRNKNEMTKGDKLAQAYRNRAAMARVYESAMLARWGKSSHVARKLYWDPIDFYERFMIFDAP